MNEQRSPAAAHRVMQSSRVLLIGHRGARAVAPENTLPSFAAALDAGVDMVEFDYRHTRDGVPVVLHDPTLSRTTDAKRVWRGRTHDVAARDYAELRELDAGGWMGGRFAGARIPSLEEAVAAIRPRAVPLIERKDGDPATCARFLEKGGLVNEVVVIAFDWNFLVGLAGLVPEQQLGALGPSAATRRIARGIDRNRLGASVLDRILEMGIRLVVWSNRVNRASVAASHARGMRVWIYTVNSPDEALRLASIGVDGIITDNPALIGRALAHRSPHPARHRTQ